MGSRKMEICDIHMGLCSVFLSLEYALLARLELLWITKAMYSASVLIVDHSWRYLIHKEGVIAS